jgi:autotransporter-associated beta strand protein
VVATTLIDISDGLIGNFRGHDIGTVTLLANTSYIVGANYGGGDRQQEGNNLTGWGINGITLVGGRYGGTGGQMPTDGWSYMIGPNFGYSLPVLGLAWSGGTSEWSTNPTVLNWAGNTTAYTDGQDVVFDDSVGTGSTTVDISVADVTPTNVIFNNNTKTYTLTGTKGITGGTGLTMKGSGQLIINNVNTYTGITNVNAGTLTINAGTVATLNVPKGRANLNSPAAATIANVSGTGLLALAGAVSQLNVSGGRVNVGPNARAATATLSAGTVNAGTNALAITGSLKDSGRNVFTWTAGAGSAFLASGDNIRDPGVARTLTLTGGTLTSPSKAA